MESGVTVVSLFFKNVFGKQAQRALSVFVALSALGVCTKPRPPSPETDLTLHAERRYSCECEIQLQTLILVDLPYVRHSKQLASTKSSPKKACPYLLETSSGHQTGRLTNHHYLASSFTSSHRCVHCVSCVATDAHRTSRSSSLSHLRQMSPIPSFSTSKGTPARSSTSSSSSGCSGYGGRSRTCPGRSKVRKSLVPARHE